MIDRQSAGLLPEVPHTVCRAPDGKILHEELLTRGGFDGPFSYFYHRFPVPPHREASISHRGWHAPRPDPQGPGPLSRRLYLSERLIPGGMPVDSRTPILFNRDVTVLLAQPAETD